LHVVSPLKEFKRSLICYAAKVARRKNLAAIMWWLAVFFMLVDTGIRKDKISDELSFSETHWSEFAGFPASCSLTKASWYSKVQICLKVRPVPCPYRERCFADCISCVSRELDLSGFYCARVVRGLHYCRNGWMCRVCLLSALFISCLFV